VVTEERGSLVVGTPSMSSKEPSDGRPRNDHPMMPVPVSDVAAGAAPRPRPTSRMRTPPIRQTA
jgi:hypothetical protein